MNNPIALILKGAAMGAANVIPGVSGGTVAFVTGIYERLLTAVKSCDAKAVKLLLTGKLQEFSKRIDFWFLLWLVVGIIASFVTLAKLLEFLFENHPIFVWAFFFGLILASIYFVGKKVTRWSIGPIIALIIGAGIATGVALMTPAQENSNPIYLVLCGVVAMASMIIPGLSGSFVLLLMGNYQLIMIESVNRLVDRDFSVLKILLPVGIGAVLGLVALSHLLSWIFKRFHNIAVALLTGFVAGSLLTIWPWKVPVTETFQDGTEIKEKVISYDWQLPTFNYETLFAISLIVLGAVCVYLMEKFGGEAES